MQKRGLFCGITFVVLLGQREELRTKSTFASPAEKQMVGHHAVAQERCSLIASVKERGLKLQMQLVAAIVSCGSYGLFQCGFVVSKEKHIVHITHIDGYAQCFFHIVVETREIVIGEILARKVSDRHAASFGGFVALYQAMKEVQQLFVLEQAHDACEKYGVVYAVKVVAYVQLSYK